MSFGIRQVDCADAVINNLDTLLTMAVYLLGLKHIDAWTDERKAAMSKRIKEVRREKKWQSR